MSDVYPRLKPEFAATHVREFEYEFRLRTPEEREEYERQREAAERERTRGWPVCVCCEKPKPPVQYHVARILVCDQCVHRGAGYGRIQGRIRAMRWDDRAWEINAAMAVIRAMEWELRWQHRNRTAPQRLAFPPILTLPNSQGT